MSKQKNIYPVLIAGGGPVGLFLGCYLQYLDIECRVLEKRKEPIKHSRSLGIHPVSLELFERIDIEKPFVESGIKIYKGHAFSESKKLGTVHFSDGPLPFNYILSLPQYKTEQILKKQLHKLNPDALIPSAHIKKLNHHPKHVEILFLKDGQEYSLESQFLVGCDGKNSFVRRESDIPFKGKRYPDTFLMGDFTDNTSFGNEAAVFLHPSGLVESFPVTNNMRRWVVKTDHYISDPNCLQLKQILEHRIQHSLGNAENKMISSFGVQRLVAETCALERLALAGDAAHVVSPIGGQGMNLGWLDAGDLAVRFDRIFHKKTLPRQELASYSQTTLKRVQKVIRRSEMNMRLGRKSNLPFLKELTVQMMLNTPLQHIMRNLFTMRKLERWPF